MTRNTSSLADPAMLSKIDRLFACNVGHYIDLPQIVVVGDQSSGKSSVLEGLTRLPFPRDSGLCTRFATQITFRRCSKTGVSVSVIPGKDADQDHRDAVRGWKKADLPSLDHSSFTAIMREVEGVMGIDKSRTFSSDVLSIEVKGPDQEHLTVIDVPGIFQRVTKDVTTKEDKDFVKEMVYSYMKNPRSVMLTVIPANVDVATQLILEMAEDVDKDGQRTLGVLTKPDLIDKGAEKTAVDMVGGRTHQLNLGWCLVRNPGQQDILNTSLDRYAAEAAFFKSTAPWNDLPRDRVGVESLRERLQLILAVHIRREFPKVKAEVTAKLKEVRSALESMGPKRDTPSEQASYLVDMATRFQAMTTQALEAKYVDDFFDKTPTMRLATKVVNRNEEFSSDFASFGHTYQFSDDGEDEHADSKPLGTFNFGAGSSAGKSSAKKRSDAVLSPPSYPSFCNSRKIRFSNEEGPYDLLYTNVEVATPKPTGVLKWLTSIYTAGRGFGLGNFGPSLLSTTMKAQTENWDALASGYISDIVGMTDFFIRRLLSRVCPDRDALGRLEELLADQLLARYQRAIEQVTFILNVERNGDPATLNHYFNDNLEKCRQKRLRALAGKKSYTDASGHEVVRVNELMETKSMSNIEHTVQDLHDTLHSYYKVACKRIIDTITIQATGFHIISGPDSPLKLFNPTFVTGLSPEQLQEVAGENALVKRRRVQLLKELDDLEKGRVILC